LIAGIVDGLCAEKEQDNSVA